MPCNAESTDFLFTQLAGTSEIRIVQGTTRTVRIESGAQVLHIYGSGGQGGTCEFKWEAKPVMRLTAERTVQALRPVEVSLGPVHSLDTLEIGPVSELDGATDTVLTARESISLESNADGAGGVGPRIEFRSYLPDSTEPTVFITMENDRTFRFRGDMFRGLNLGLANGTNSHPRTRVVSQPYKVWDGTVGSIHLDGTPGANKLLVKVGSNVVVWVSTALA